MICDCCDGSDEWGGYVTCPNTCKELYKQYYAERIKSQEEAMEGYKIRAGINRYDFGLFALQLHILYSQLIPK